MEEHEESAPSDKIEPLVMSMRDFDDVVETLFEERFGYFDYTNPLHVRLRRKLRASADVCEADESKVLIRGEVARQMRQWLKEHGR